MTTEMGGMASRIVLFFSASALCLAGCSSDERTAPESTAIQPKSGIVVTSPATFWLTRRMLGEQVPVWLVCPENTAQTGWVPSTDDVKRMQQAEVIFLTGGSEENWIQGVTIPQARLADLAALAKLDMIPLDETQMHQHGPAGVKTSKVWRRGVNLDPGMLSQQAAAVRDRLLELVPQLETTIQSGHSSVAGELEALSASVNDLRSRASRIRWVDPVGNFQYLIRAAGGSADAATSQKLAELLLPEKVLDEPERLARLLEQLTRDKRVILLPKGSRFDSCETRLREQGTSFLRLDSLDYRISPDEYLDIYQKNTSTLEALVKSHAD